MKIKEHLVKQVQDRKACIWFNRKVKDKKSDLNIITNKVKRSFGLFSGTRKYYFLDEDDSWLCSSKLRPSDMTPIPLMDFFENEAEKPVYAINLWASGGSNGIHDYLMSDGSIRTCKPSELPPLPSGVSPSPLEPDDKAEGEDRESLLLELIDRLKGYIVFIGEELNESTLIAASHGWKSSRYEEGERQRKHMAELDKKIFSKEQSKQ